MKTKFAHLIMDRKWFTLLMEFQEMKKTWPPFREYRQVTSWTAHAFDSILGNVEHPGSRSNACWQKGT